jgi:hypothetical protein
MHEESSRAENTSRQKSDALSGIAHFYSSLLIFTHIAPPKNPRNNPKTDAPQPIKFKRNVEGIIRMRVNKGMVQPTRSRTEPRMRRNRGFVINSKPLNREARKGRKEKQ